jgi:hypothetical protein
MIYLLRLGVDVDDIAVERSDAMLAQVCTDTTAAFGYRFPPEICGSVRW